MAETPTTNKALWEVTVGTDLGTWGPFINTNQVILDNSLGGVATIPLTNAPVTLSSAQYQCVFITFTGNLSGNVAVTFPNVGSFYTIQNLTGNTSAFQVTLQTGAGQVVGCPWGEAFDIMTVGGDVKFRNLGRVGQYWDYGGSSVPAWVSNCTVPPYLYCNGQIFSSATYPILHTILNGNTVPDFRGRGRFYYNDGTGRITTATGGVNGDAVLSAGGVQSITLSTQNLPNTSFPVTDPGHAHGMTTFFGETNIAGGGGNHLVSYTSADSPPIVISNLTDVHTTGVTVNSGGSGIAVQNLPPLAIGGITLIRSA